MCAVSVKYPRTDISPRDGELSFDKCSNVCKNAKLQQEWQTDTKYAREMCGKFNGIDNIYDSKNCQLIKFLSCFQQSY